MSQPCPRRNRSVQLASKSTCFYQLAVHIKHTKLLENEPLTRACQMLWAARQTCLMSQQLQLGWRRLALMQKINQNIPEVAECCVQIDCNDPGCWTPQSWIAKSNVAKVGYLFSKSFSSGRGTTPRQATALLKPHETPKDMLWTSANLNTQVYSVEGRMERSGLLVTVVFCKTAQHQKTHWLVLQLCSRLGRRDFCRITFLSRKMLLELPVHDLSAGSKQLLQSSDNKSGLSASSSSHLKKILRLRENGRHLLLGRNGCGKTTLLRAIASGELQGWPKSLSTYLVDQELSMDTFLSPLEVVLKADQHLYSLHKEVQHLEALCTDDSSEANVASARLGEIYIELNESGAESEVEWRARARSLLKGLGFEETQCNEPISQLSGGWRVRVAIATSLFMRPRLLMLDEPTNHLDLGAIEWLQHHLVDEYKGTVLCVSHDREFINEVCTDIIIFADQNLTYFHGTLDMFEEAAMEKARHMEREAASIERKRDTILQTIQHKEQQVASAQKNKAKNKAKNKYAILHDTESKGTSSLVSTQQQKLERLGMEKTEDGKRFKSSEHGHRAGSAADDDGKMSAAPFLQRHDPSLRFGFATGDGLRISKGTPLLQVKAVTYEYPGADVALKNVDLSISAGDRVAIQGRNGAGKSTLVKLITGEIEPTDGEVWRQQSLKVSVLHQHDTDALAQVSASPVEWLGEFYPKKKSWSYVSNWDLLVLRAIWFFSLLAPCLVANECVSFLPKFAWNIRNCWCWMSQRIIWTSTPLMPYLQLSENFKVLSFWSHTIEIFCATLPTSCTLFQSGAEAYHLWAELCQMVHLCRSHPLLICLHEMSKTNLNLKRESSKNLMTRRRMPRLRVKSVKSRESLCKPLPGCDNFVDRASASMKPGARAEHAKLGCATSCTDRCQPQDCWKRSRWICLSKKNIEKQQANQKLRHLVGEHSGEFVLWLFYTVYYFTRCLEIMPIHSIWKINSTTCITYK